MKLSPMPCHRFDKNIINTEDYLEIIKISPLSTLCLSKQAFYSQKRCWNCILVCCARKSPAQGNLVMSHFCIGHFILYHSVLVREYEFCRS
jgi:hypothetical protein